MSHFWPLRKIGGRALFHSTCTASVDSVFSASVFLRCKFSTVSMLGGETDIEIHTGDCLERGIINFETRYIISLRKKGILMLSNQRSMGVSRTKIQKKKTTSLPNIGFTTAPSMLTIQLTEDAYQDYTRHIALLLHSQYH